MRFMPRYDRCLMTQIAKRAKMSRWLGAAGLLIVGTVFSLALFQALQRADSRRTEFQFRRDARDRAFAFKTSLTHGLDTLVALDAFYAATPNVGRAGFRAFTNTHMLEEPGVAFLGWAPRVASKDRAELERSVRAQTDERPEIAAALSRFEIFEMASDTPRPASPRSEYFPVVYAEPARIATHTLGFDVASDPVQREGLSRARGTGQMAASQRDLLRPDAEDHYGVAVFSPIYAPPQPAESGERQLLGFVMGMFDVGAILRPAMEAMESSGLDIAIHDLSADPSESLLYFHPSETSAALEPWTVDEIRTAGGLVLTETIQVGDRDWLISCRPAPGYGAARQTYAPFLALAGGLLLSAIIAASFLMILEREAQSRQYASELLSAKEQLEEEARQRERSRHREEQILDSLPLNVYLKSAEGRIEFLNAGALSFLGVTREEAIGKTDFDLFPHAIAEGLRKWDSEALAADRVIEAEEEVVVGGETRVLLAGKRSIVEKGSDSRSVVGFSIDISNLKQAQEALRVSEARFRELVDHIPNGVAVLEVMDNGERFLFKDFNRAAAQREGVAREDIIDREIFDMFPYLKEIGMPEVLRAVWRTGQTKHIPEVHNPGGREGWMDFQVYKLPSGEVVIVGTDMTERKQLESDFLHAQKMEAIGRLAGGVAHDFNNLLQVVLGNTELLLLSDDAATAGRPMLTEIQEQAERGAQLARQLLVFSRREFYSPSRIDINDFVKGAATLLARLIKENIALVLDLAEEALPIDGDRGQLEQTLMNLVVNASDAMPEGGELTIRSGGGDLAEGDGAGAWFSVSDTGTGIPDELVDRIFDPYFTTKSAARGTGLGLAVVHGIVSVHGGHVDLDNRPGEGITFRVTLPRSSREGSEAAVETPQVAVPRAEGGRVLVVEDQDPVREMLSTMLTSLGYEVSTASDGAEARARIAADEYQLLVSDIVLPDTTGVELAHEFRTRRPSLAVLLVSGYAEETVRARGVELKFLQKPFRLADLARQASSALLEAKSETQRS